MKLSSLRRAPFIAYVYSWIHGTRCTLTGHAHRVARNNSLLHKTSIEIVGSNCELVIGNGTRIWNSSIKLVGKGARLHIGAGCRLSGVKLIAEDDGSSLIIGDNALMYDATLLSQEGGLLQVGSNCMIAQSAELRNSDSHTIRDASTGERINPPADVIVGDRVWIGLHSMVFKGSRIGSGTVIAAKSLVTGDIPAGCIALGTPAKPVRSGINWERPRATSAEAQSRLRK